MNMLTGFSARYAPLHRGTIRMIRNQTLEHAIALIQVCVLNQFHIFSTKQKINNIIPQRHQHHCQLTSLLLESLTGFVNSYS